MPTHQPPTTSSGQWYPRRTSPYDTASISTTAPAVSSRRAAGERSQGSSTSTAEPYATTAVVVCPDGK
ncbi:hypothetical protein GCM10020256_19430 [Streptomyces thermocoprophilus]